MKLFKILKNCIGGGTTQTLGALGGAAVGGA